MLAPPGTGYRRGMRLALAFWLAAAAPACAFEGLFDGIDAGWAQAQEALRQHKLEEARRARARGPRLKPLGDVFKPHRVPAQDPRCVFAAVAGRLGAATAKEPPPVWYASRTLLYDYASWIYAEHGSQAPSPKTIATVYLPRQNAIFLDDEGESYTAARSIDDRLAGLFALAVRHRAGSPVDSPESRKVQAETELWFNAEHTSKRLSACPRD